MSVPSYIKLSPNMDMATLINALNNNFNQIQSQDRRKVITDEDGNDRIILGKQGDGTYAIRVSGDGKDVDDASQSDLVMSSDWKMWKIINSGNVTLDPTAIRRSGTLALNSTYIGYTADIFIKIDGLKEIFGSIQPFIGNLQVFIRDDSNKNDIHDSGTLYQDGTNWAVYNHSYFCSAQGYLTIRTDVRWMAGTVTITPRSWALPSQRVYWEIANPTRRMQGGMGGGGVNTGKYVYYDSVIYNGGSTLMTGYDLSLNYRTIEPGAFGNLTTKTIRFFDDTISWRYPKDSGIKPLPAFGN